MSNFRVRCFKDGIWDERDLVEVTADSPEQAATLACGEPVRGGVGAIHELRAHVWQVSGEKPAKLTTPEFLFYAPSAK